MRAQRASRDMVKETEGNYHIEIATPMVFKQLILGKTRYYILMMKRASVQGMCQFVARVYAHRPKVDVRVALVQILFESHVAASYIE